METLLKEFKSHNENDTTAVAAYLYDLLKQDRARVLLLSGNLGGGKTFITQQLGKLLGIKDNINSPTFNLMKLYNFRNKELKLNKLLHIDAYRLENYDDLLNIGFAEFLENEKTLIMIEWPKNLADYLQTLSQTYLFIDIEILSMAERIIRIYEVTY